VTASAANASASLQTAQSKLIRRSPHIAPQPFRAGSLQIEF
jgi:hypothetical protein